MLSIIVISYFLVYYFSKNDYFLKWNILFLLVIIYKYFLLLGSRNV